MNDASESPYLFRFERPEDSACYTKQVYWERLYAFFRKGPPVLAAARVVPANDGLFALYLALKEDSMPVHRQMLPQPTEAPGVGLVRSIADIIPHESRAVPAAIVQQTRRVLERTAELSARFDDPQGSSALDGQRDRPVGDRGGTAGGPAGGPMGFMAGLSERSAAVVGAGFEISRIIEQQIAQDAAADGAGDGDGGRALARRAGARRDIWRRLYSDERYVGLIKAQIDTRGGFVSPMVRRFLRFYHRSVMEKARELSMEGRFDDTFAQERFQGIVGRAEADYLRVFPCQEIVMLGRVVKGQVSPDPADPGRTRRSFQVDPETDLSSIVLQEVQGRLQRARLNAIARSSSRENIKRIRYVEEMG